MRRSKKAALYQKLEQADMYRESVKGTAGPKTLVVINGLPQGCPATLLQPITAGVQFVNGYWIATTTVTEELGGVGADQDGALRQLVHALVDRFLELSEKEERLAPGRHTELLNLRRYLRLGITPARRQ